MPSRLFSSLAFLLFPGILTAQEPDLDVVRQWLDKHQGAKSLHIEFTQSRRMAALKNPLRSHGSIWLDFPTRRFRWQSGDPPKTIVINDGERLVIAQPQRKRVEIKPAGEKRSGPASLAALAGGFPKSLPEFRRRYRILAIELDGEHYRIRTQPIRGEAARGLAQLTFFIDRSEFILRGYQATLKDGSTARYDFTKVVRNPDFPKGTFAFDATGFTKSP